MHNLSNHKGAAIRQAIEPAGATLLFLPPMMIAEKGAATVLEDAGRR